MRMILIGVRIGMAVMVLSPYLPTKRLLCGNNPTLMLVLANHYVSECLLGWLVSAHFYVCKCLLVSVYLL